LKDKISAAIVADDEDDVALPPLLFRGEFAEINAAQPITRNLEARARFPFANANAPRSDGRVGLGATGKRTEGRHMPPAVAAVVAHAINIDREGRRRIGAHVKRLRVAGAHNGSGAIAFDPRTTIFGFRINAGFAKHPIPRSGACVFVGD
jgi:hypothetical protein